MNRLKMFRGLLFLLVALLLIGVGWQVHTWRCRNESHKNRRVKASGFRFTSPLLDVELPEGLQINQEPILFKQKINEYVQRQIDIGTVQKVSVYFRDLQDGPWFGINENQEFDPASMMKVPVMVAWLKRAEKDPQVLKQRFVYEGVKENLPQQNIKPASSIVPGNRYTVDELLHYMLNFSDNNATTLLYSKLKPVELNAVLDGMDIVNNPNGGTNSTTVHGFSGFFRILYNASYLNRQMSEKALQYLTLQDFPQGISAGVPEGIIVAAKFGENSIGDNKQLHEFGIVYHPKGHYVLGVMTQGRDFDRQAEIIRGISKEIYEAINSATIYGMDH